MKIKVLGSGSSEGFPSLFCNCNTCQKARKLGNKNLRTRSQFLVDDNLMIDFGDDTFSHSLCENIVLSKLKYLFITHSHIDHFNPTIFRYRGGLYTSVALNDTLEVYSPPAVKELYEQMVRGKPSDAVKSKIIFTTPTEFEVISSGNYKIHILLARHAKNEKCFLYLVERDGKRVLFGNDSNYFPDETFEYLKGIHIDLAFLDCTYGFSSKGKDNSHMNFSDNLKVKETFYINGTANDRTIFVCTHFTHTCKNTHEELYEAMEGYGFNPSYDGMAFEI